MPYSTYYSSVTQYLNDDFISECKYLRARRVTTNPRFHAAILSSSDVDKVFSKFSFGMSRSRVLISSQSFGTLTIIPGNTESEFDDSVRKADICSPR